MKKILLFLFLTSVCFGNIEIAEEVRWYDSGRDFFFSISASESMSESIGYIFPPDGGGAGQALLTDGGDPVAVMTWGTPTTSAAHNLTSTTHSDAATGTVLRGDILTGQTGTPKWTRLGISSTIGSTLTKIVGTDGTDSGFRTLANFALDIDSILDHDLLGGTALVGDSTVHDVRYYTETELSSNDTSTSGSTLIGMAALSNPTYTTLRDDFTLSRSAGMFTGGTISDIGSENIKILAGTGAIRPSDDHTAELLFFDWPEIASVATTTDDINYIGVEYNSGNPRAVVRLVDNWNLHDEFPLGSVVNEGGTLHVVNKPHFVANAIGHTLERFHQTMPISRDKHNGGLILGESGDNNQNVTMTSGALWDRLSRFPFGNINTAGADTFDTYLGTTPSQTGISQWEDSYDNNPNQGGTKTALGTNKFGTLWFYLELDGGLVMIYGTSNAAIQAQAENEGVPAIEPERVTDHGVLLGRYIIKEGETVPVAIETVFTTTFASTGVTSHLNLTDIGTLTHAAIDTLLSATPGTAAAGKALIVSDPDKNIAGLGSVGMGKLTATITTGSAHDFISTVASSAGTTNIIDLERQMPTVDINDAVRIRLHGNINGTNFNWAAIDGFSEVNDVLGVRNGGMELSVSVDNMLTTFLSAGSDLNAEFKGNIVIPNDGFIGSVGEPTAIKIAAFGDVTLSDDLNVGGVLDIGGNIEMTSGRIEGVAAIEATTKLDFEISSDAQLNITDGKLAPTLDNDIDLGDAAHKFKDLYIDGTANIDTFTDGTLSITGGSITGAAAGTFSGTVQASIFTDSFTTITGGNYTGVVSMAGSDLDITAGTGDYTSTGLGTFGSALIGDLSITDEGTTVVLDAVGDSAQYSFKLQGSTKMTIIATGFRFNDKFGYAESIVSSGGNTFGYFNRTADRATNDFFFQGQKASTTSTGANQDGGDIVINGGDAFSGGVDGDILLNSTHGRSIFGGDVILLNIPASDPSVTGQLWNDSGTVKISL